VIDPATVAVLDAWRRRQLEERLALGLGGRPVHVFTDAVGQPHTADHVTRRWTRLVASSGLPRIRFHDLRAVHFTLLLADGVPVDEVTDRGGWASAKMVLDVYRRHMPDRQPAIAARFAGLVDGPAGE
jgi:integrase